MSGFAERYVLGGVVGRGGNATVYEAVDQQLGRRVAVKIGEPTDECRMRMEREARVGGIVAHPNTCTVIDAGVTATRQPYVVMELLRGETLATRLERDGALGRAEALDIGDQLLDALEAAHDVGYLHRDIKPANIFLVPMKSGRTVAKLLDFGTARHRDQNRGDFEQVTEGRIVLGTLRYMSPEQIRGERDLDVRSDVFSVALVIVQMLAGVHPLASLDDRIAADVIGYHKVPVELPNVPADLQRVLARALEKDARRRLSSIAELRSALREPFIVEAVETGATQVLRARPTTRSVLEGWDQETERDSIPSFDPPEDPASGAVTKKRGAT